MISLIAKIPKEDAEKAFQTGWDDERFKWTAEELLHDLTRQMSDETQKAQEEVEERLEEYYDNKS